MCVNSPPYMFAGPPGDALVLAMPEGMAVKLNGGDVAVVVCVELSGNVTVCVASTRALPPV